jgi:anti-anti-sigma factor
MRLCPVHRSFIAMSGASHMTARFNRPRGQSLEASFLASESFDKPHLPPQRSDIHTIVTTHCVFFLTLIPIMAIDEPLSIESQEGKAPGTLILRLTGPVTLRNLFDFQAQLRAIQPPPPVTILDMAGVPYMDSAGMGAVINHHVHCQGKGARLIVTGISTRVHELFKMTRVDTVISQAPTVETAEASL